MLLAGQFPMLLRLRRSRRPLCPIGPAAGIILVLVLFFPAQSYSQVTEIRLPAGVVPPPLNLISKQERKDLELQRSTKKRTKLALELISGRLDNAEEKAAADEFQASLNQLGRFQALIRDTFDFLKAKEGGKKSLKNFKRFEMTLRTFLPRLEILRRGMPFEYSYHVRMLIKFVKDTRAGALEPLYDDTVIPEEGPPR